MINKLFKPYRKLNWNFPVVMLLVFILPLYSAAIPENSANHFKPLQKMLVKDGFDADQMKALYNSPSVQFDLNTISRFFAHREASLNYDQFATRKAIKKARAYMKKYQADLERAEKHYGVDKEIITAIILVETQLGTIMGSSSVFNALSTFAALSDREVREMAWKQVSNPSRLSREDFEKWSARKSKWAYAELKAFLKYTAREKMNPSDIYGSYAGALGIAQFMPSNIMAYAKDGNQDGRINLYDHADAIASIASYLKSFGWYQGLDRKKAYRVVYQYNHSRYYVNIILKIADRLKG